MLKRQDWNSLKYIYERFLRPYNLHVLVAVGINVVAGMLTTIRPLTVAPVLHGLEDRKETATQSVGGLNLNNLTESMADYLGLEQMSLIQLAIVSASLFLAVSLTLVVVNVAGHFLLSRVKINLVRNMTVAVHEHLISLPLRFFYQQKAGDLVNRITQDVARTSGSVDKIVRAILTSAAQILLSVYILFSTDVLLTSAILAVGLVHMVITRSLANKVKHTSGQLALRHGEVGASLFESIVGIKVIKSFAAEAYERSKVQKAIDNWKENMYRNRTVTYYEIPLRAMLDAGIVAAVLVLVFYFVSIERLTLAGAVMFFFLSQQLVGPLGQFFSQILGLHSMLGGAERVMELFRTSTEIVDGNRETAPLSDCIEMRRTGFAYKDGIDVLHDIDIRIGRGEMVALVGPSGGGKSTITDLLLRLYDVDRGAILYDGTDIREFRQASYRHQFGVVSQESLLFNGSIRENIVLNRAFDPELLEHAIWAANAGDFIESFPEGLDTVVGDRGVRLSGGQRQRVAIARAIYSKPSILILDEATSALDSANEVAVQKAIDRISKEVTVLAVAHRLSTVMHADRIIVVKNGSIEATGRHAELLESSQTYRTLCKLQFRQPDQVNPDRLAM